MRHFHPFIKNKVKAKYISKSKYEANSEEFHIVPPFSIENRSVNAIKATAETPIKTEKENKLSQSFLFLKTLLKTIKKPKRWRKVIKPPILSKLPQKDFSKFTPVREVKTRIPINRLTRMVKIFNLGR